MKRRESQFQTRLNTWAKHFWKDLPHDRFGNAILELKTSRSRSLPFDAVSDKQVRNLLQARYGFFNHTWSDFDRLGTPADCVFLFESNAFIAVQYWRPRHKKFYLIPIEEWVNEKETSTRQSLTEDRAKEIGYEFSF